MVYCDEHFKEFPTYEASYFGDCNQENYCEACGPVGYAYM